MRRPLGAFRTAAPRRIDPLLSPSLSERLLECLRGPGGKSTHLAELMPIRGLVLALIAFRWPPGPSACVNCRGLGAEPRSAGTKTMRQLASELPAGGFASDSCRRPLLGSGTLARHCRCPAGAITPAAID